MGRRSRRSGALTLALAMLIGLWPGSPLVQRAQAYGETVASPRYIAAAVMPNGQVRLVFSNSGTEVRFARYTRETALDPSVVLGAVSSAYPQLATFRGRLVAAFVDTRPGLSGRLAFRASDDSGASWSAPLYPFAAETFDPFGFAPRVVASRDSQTLYVFSGSGVPRYR
ncbi:MAG: exo-alpha-sialidase, partial [Chloroflexi bacterium]|nr:exo-alpha-sialidase [Chloroflexota bacterium]